MMMPIGESLTNCCDLQSLPFSKSDKQGPHLTQMCPWIPEVYLINAPKFVERFKQDARM